MIRRIIAAVLVLVLTLPIFGGRDAAAAEAAPESIRLPIIMYHEVKHNKWGKDVISPWEFESDLKFLRKNQYTTVTMADLIYWLYGAGDLPPNPVMLTFDDGYLSTYRYVLPLLKKYDMKIVMSIIVKNTDDFTHIPDDNVDYSHVTWAQLGEMLATGLVEVQNHSYDLHAVKNGRYGCIRKKGEALVNFEDVMESDIMKAQTEIFEMTGRAPTTFAYPYGRYSEEADAVLRKLGFMATLSCRYGINVLSRAETQDLFRLKRLCRAHGVRLEALLDEAYKTVRKKPSESSPQILK